MGYALLYEAMLDSVLSARDRFLRPGGVMAPSQCRMVLGMCDPQEIWKQRVGFWNTVYGFDMGVMAEDAFTDAVIDCVPSSEVLTTSTVIKVRSLVNSMVMKVLSLTRTGHQHPNRHLKIPLLLLLLRTLHPSPPHQSR